MPTAKIWGGQPPSEKETREVEVGTRSIDFHVVLVCSVSIYIISINIFIYRLFIGGIRGAFTLLNLIYAW